MNKSAFSKRVAALRERLKKLPCDTAWIIQPENRRYLSGFKAQHPNPHAARTHIPIFVTKAIRCSSIYYFWKNRPLWEFNAFRLLSQLFLLLSSFKGNTLERADLKEIRRVMRETSSKLSRCRPRKKSLKSSKSIQEQLAEG